jgi:hypothetical protein
MTSGTDPESVRGIQPQRSPSIRRVLGGYLRLRSPSNLCLDAGLVVLLSYVAGSLHRWISIGQMTPRPPDQFSMWWSLNEFVQVTVGMLYLVGIGLFFIGCARFIADRIESPRR